MPRSTLKLSHDEWKALFDTIARSNTDDFAQLVALSGLIRRVICVLLIGLASAFVVRTCEGTTLPVRAFSTLILREQGSKEQGLIRP